MTEIVFGNFRNGFRIPRGAPSLYFSLAESFIGDVRFVHDDGSWGMEDVPVALLLLHLIEEIGAVAYRGRHVFVWRDPDSDREVSIAAGRESVTFTGQGLGEDFVVPDAEDFCGRLHAEFSALILGDQKEVLKLGPTLMDNHILRHLLMNV